MKWVKLAVAGAHCLSTNRLETLRPTSKVLNTTHVNNTVHSLIPFTLTEPMSSRFTEALLLRVEWSWTQPAISPQLAASSPGFYVVTKLLACMYDCRAHPRLEKHSTISYPHGLLPVPCMHSSWASSDTW